MPSPITLAMAGMPASVAGILIRTFGRSTILCSSIACATVASVSCARRGSTSMDTRPSTPFDASNCGARIVARSTHVVGGHRGDGGVDIGAALCELTDLSVVRRSLGQCRLEDRRVGRDTHDRLRVDEVLQVAGLDAIPREVVEPDGNACSGELFGIHVLCHRDHPFTAARERCAASTVASAVMPNSRNKVL